MAIKKIIHFILFFFRYLFFFKNNSIKGKDDIYDTINRLFDKELSYITPWQNKDELFSLIKTINKHKPKYILEIGTASGGTLFLSSLYGTDDAKIISVDLPGGKFGGGYPWYKTFLYKNFSRGDQIIRLIRGNSHDINVFNQVSDILKGKKIDYLFIDGDHSYEGVKEDYERFQPLLNENGIVAFHDIVKDNRKEPSIFVSRFWNEIKNDFNFDEYVNDINQNCMGIGVIFMRGEKS